MLNQKYQIELERLRKDNLLLREVIKELKAKDIRSAAINLLRVMSPIDWSFVFSAPMNDSSNAVEIMKAMEYLMIKLDNKGHDAIRAPDSESA